MGGRPEVRNSAADPYPPAEGSARTLLAGDPAARPAGPRCGPGQGARPCRWPRRPNDSQAARQDGQARRRRPVIAAITTKLGGKTMRSKPVIPWAAIFIAMAPVAAAAAVLVAVAVPTSRDPGAAAVDLPGLVLSSAAMVLLVFTIIEAPTYGWAAARSVAGFAAAAVLLAAFIAGERRAAHPMLAVGLFRNLRFSAASGAVTVSFFTLFGFIFLITQYFQFVRGYGPLSTGVRLLPVALSVGAGSVVGTQLAVRAGTKLVVTTGLV